MTQESNTPGDLPMICATLQGFVESDLLTVKQMAALLDIAPCSIYRYLSGQTEPSWSQVRVLFRQCGRAEAQRALLACLADGTGWLSELITIEADANGDGIIDTNDVMDDGILAMGELQKIFIETRAQQATGMRRMAPQKAETIKRQIRSAIRELLAAASAVDLLTAPEPSGRHPRVTHGSRWSELPTER